jgi:hypothetical protein
VREEKKDDGKEKKKMKVGDAIFIQDKRKIRVLKEGSVRPPSGRRYNGGKVECLATKGSGLLSVCSIGQNLSVDRS